MFDFSNSETAWLNITNITLGLVTIICLVVVGRIFFGELYVHIRERVKIPSLQDDHSFVFPELKITMADGGKRIDETELSNKRANDDEAHIIRAEN